jgi:hypothetical protein
VVSGDVPTEGSDDTDEVYSERNPVDADSVVSGTHIYDVSGVVAIAKRVKAGESEGLQREKRGYLLRSLLQRCLRQRDYHNNTHLSNSSLMRR